MDDRLTPRVVEVGEPTCHPEGNAVAGEPIQFLRGGHLRSGRRISRILPRVGTPIVDVGPSRWELMQPRVQVTVGHKLIQNQLFFPCKIQSLNDEARKLDALIY